MPCDSTTTVKTVYTTACFSSLERAAASLGLVLTTRAGYINVRSPNGDLVGLINSETGAAVLYDQALMAQVMAEYGRDIFAGWMADNQDIFTATEVENEYEIRGQYGY